MKRDQIKAGATYRGRGMQPRNVLYIYDNDRYKDPKVVRFERIYANKRTIGECTLGAFAAWASEEVTAK